ncbi:MAG TPA: aspartate carbamoyltransferase [Dehalococcoidia bacterium]|nr:aspartate carbamoyltransferase [Dehalococcoidia bacterium]
MNLANRNLVTIDDLSNGEIEALFSLADEMANSPNEQSGLCQGKIMASLFFEPSTRTRLSFEAGMLRLGGRVISAVDIGASSLAKGESIADMAKVVGSYADIIVIRHPWEGAARVVADYAGIPVINAGDGSHEHPTQTLCDIYTIRKERQTVKGLRIALWGDLKHGRTVHSLIYALARFGATILFCPGPGLEMPEHVLRRLSTEYKGELKICRNLNQELERSLFPIDAIYMTPSSPHQLTMLPDISIRVELKAGVDALYVTRLQKERQAPMVEEQELKRGYPVVDKKLLKGKEFKKTLVMHPLPRVDELTHEVDADPRSMYFKQAAYGMPVRMALLALLLGAKEVTIPEEQDSFVRKIDYPVYKRDSGVKCPNTNCVSNQETEVRYIKPEFKIVSREPLTLRCIYCEHELHPRYIASSEWHEGKLENKKYHSADSHFAWKINPENLIIFASEKEAQAQQFKPSSYARQ